MNDEVKDRMDGKNADTPPAPSSPVSCPMPQVSLKARTVSGVKWQMINKIGQKVISVAAFAIHVT